MLSPESIPAGTCSIEVTIFDHIVTNDCDLYLAYLCFTYGGELYGYQVNNSNKRVYPIKTNEPKT